MNITGNYQLRKDDTWELTAELPSDPITHKRNRRYRTIHGTEKDAKRELRKFLSEIEGGLYVATDHTTVSDWLDIWITTYQEPVNSPTTVQRYKSLKRQYIDGTSLGQMTLQSLNSLIIQSWVNSLKTSPLTGKPLSVSTIRHAYNLLPPAMEKAVDAGILAKSPCTRISLPKGDKKEAVVYDEEQMKQLIAVAKGTEMEIVIDMELCFGMRRGELLGLQWQDIDWENKKLHIVRNRVLAESGVIVKSPKTKNSVRTLDIPDQLLIKLKAHKNKSIKRLLTLEKGFKEDNYIIIHPDGEPIYPE